MKTRIAKWFNIATMDCCYGLQVHMGLHGWQNVARNGSPEIFDTRDEAIALRKELRAAGLLNPTTQR